jgi:hypothetical protein
MLEFIVLGQVPGTDIQLTFQQIAAFAGILTACLVCAHQADAYLTRWRNSRINKQQTAL